MTPEAELLRWLVWLLAAATVGLLHLLATGRRNR